MHHRRRKASLAALAALTLTLGASACGGSGGTGSTSSSPSSSSGGSSSSSGAGGSTGKAAAQAAVQPYLSAPKSIPLDQPLSRKPDPGKTIIVTENPQDVTRKTNDGLEVGAKLLGWTVKRQPVGSGPEDPAKAFDAALDQKPDAVLVSGNPASTLRAQLDRAKSLNIPVLLNDVADPVGQDGTVYTTGLDSPTQTALWGKMTADYAVAQGAKHVLVVDLSLYPILHAYSQGVVDEIKKISPSTKTTLIDTQITDLVGGKVPGTVVSELQRSPDTDWVLLALGDMSTGLRAALRGASLADKVKIGGESASTANVTALKNGEEDAWTGFAAEIHGMYRIDALARIFNGESVEPDNTSQLPTQLLTQDNIGSAPLDSDGYYVGVPDYPAHFSKIWQLTG